MIFSDHNIFKGKVSMLEHLQKVFKDALFEGIDIHPERFIDYWLDNDSHVEHDMIAFIKQLKNPLFLGTNQEFLRTQRIKELIGHVFQGCFSSCEIGAMKPERAFYTHIEAALGTKPFFIDDTPAHIDSARDLGWPAFLYTT